MRGIAAPLDLQDERAQRGRRRDRGCPGAGTSRPGADAVDLAHGARPRRGSGARPVRQVTTSNDPSRNGRAATSPGHELHVGRAAPPDERARGAQHRLGEVEGATTRRAMPAKASAVWPAAGRDVEHAARRAGAAPQASSRSRSSPAGVQRARHVGRRARRRTAPGPAAPAASLTSSRSARRDDGRGSPRRAARGRSGATPRRRA